MAQKELLGSIFRLKTCEIFSVQSGNTEHAFGREGVCCGWSWQRLAIAPSPRRVSEQGSLDGGKQMKPPREQRKGKMEQ